MAIPKKMFTDTSSFMGIILLTNLLNFGRNFAVAKLLGPYLTGLCMSLLLIPQTLAYLNLGLPNAMTFLIPYNRSKNDYAKADEIRNKIFSFTSFTAVLTLAGILLFALFFRPKGIAIYLVYTAIFAFLGQFIRYFSAYFAAEKNFTKLGMVELIYTAILFATSVSLIYFFQAHGFWLAMIISIVSVTAYCVRDYSRHEKIVFVKFTPAEISKLFSTGITMTFSAVIYLPFINLSKLYITAAVGVEAVGYYILSVFVISLIAIVPKTISRVFMPHLSSLKGDEENLATIYSIFIRTQLYTFGLAAAAAAGGLLFMDPLVRAFLPQYVPGIPAAQIMLLAGLPYSLIDNANNMLIVMHNKKTLWRILTTSIISLTIILTAALFHYPSIIKVSAALAATFTLYAILLHNRIKSIVRESGATRLPLANDVGGI